MLTYSIFDLAFTYIERFYQEEPSTEEKRQIIDDFKDLLFFGWTTEDIVKHLRAFMVKYPGIKPELPRLFSKLHKISHNLLSPDDFYYHNQLRITPGPPKRELDYNTGEIIKIEEDFYLEIRASYTIDNLVDYFVDQFQLDFTPDERKRTIGGFKYLLKTYTVEQILFMIDSASNHVYSEDLNRRDFNPLKLSDWRSKAEDNLNNKRTENKVSGDDRIVPRKRVFTFRSRDSIQ